MLERIEDITVIATDEFLSYEGDMIFVDADSPFKSQPLIQVYVAMGDSEESLPDMWQESHLFGDLFYVTFEDKTIHVFISLELQDQLEPGQFLFIKVIAIGEPPETTKRPIRLA